MHITVKGKKIGPGEPCFIIAEAGSNHNGSMELAKRLIDVAAESGADAVKFQRFNTEELVHKNAPKAIYQKETTGEEQNQYEMLKALEISEENFLELKTYAEQKGLIFFVSIFDHASIKSADRMDMPIIKIGSGDTNNLPMIRECARTGRVIMISTGMSDMAEIQEAVDTMKEEGNEKLILFQCTSAYPCPNDQVHLRAMKTIADAFPYPVGYSDHTTSLVIPAASVAMGATVYEKHYTLDKNLPGPDHSMSANPEELKLLIQNIREVEAALGSAEKKKHALEQDIIDVARKSMHAKVNIPAGTIVDESHIYSTRPSKGGIPPNKIHLIIGRKASRDIKQDEQIRGDMLNV